MLFGTVPTSIPQIILAANWLFEGNFGVKWNQLKSNRLFWILISFFILHIVGMLYTNNTQRGLDDLRNKMPLFVLPLIFFSTKPLSVKEFKLLFSLFFLSVVVSSFWCYLVYAGYTHKVVFDVRKASVFMSHIRFSLFIAFAIIGLIYGFFTERLLTIKIVFGTAVLWLLFFMYKLEMATGFVCLLIVGIIMIILYAFTYLKKPQSLFVLFVIVALSVYVLNSAQSSLTLFDKDPSLASNKISKGTASGRGYFHDTLFQLAENGTLVLINDNDDELEQEWNKRSSLPFDKLDKKGNNLRFTILRYLASKGLCKDSVAINSLTKTEIEQIENGFSNYKYTMHSGLKSRWRELVWEYAKYKRGENPSGHTLMMRLEFWKTACYIIREFPFFGVGTGDIQDAFNVAYEETNSTLDSVWRLRCHNQYLAIGVAFGIVGLLLFFVYLFLPPIILRKKLHPLFWSFFSIVLLSFITEDTLETQSGVTFFIFFYTLFLWLAKSNSEIPERATPQ